MTAPRQLSMFVRGSGLHGKRKAAPAHEFKVHCMVADVLRRWTRPGWRHSHLPFGEHRTAATGARLKRMGVTRGWPDFIFVHERGRVCWLELKRRGATLTDHQAELARFLRSAGHDYATVWGFDDAVATLTAWGVVAGVHPQ